MTLPDDVREGVEGALVTEGLATRIDRVTPVAGGCINHGARLDTDTGGTFFLKWNRQAPSGLFEAEAEGLGALASAAPLRVPAPLAWATDGAATPWLLMEYIAPGNPAPAAQRHLGRGLAVLHEAGIDTAFGWSRDNWIGSLAQLNEPTERWADFWRDRRIGPQLALAREAGHTRHDAFDDLLDVIPLALHDVHEVNLLHGDLWSGNWFAGGHGEAVLIDPAVYRGHGEVDLAMSELFGGFGPAFYAAYEEVRPMASEYDAYRRDLYQLYYLLVHVNLFGGAYATGSLQAARRVLAELR